MIIKRLKNKSITSIFLLSMLFITGIIMVPINYLWIRSEYNKFDAEAAQQKERYLESEKEKLKHNVDIAVESVYFLKRKLMETSGSEQKHYYNKKKLQRDVLERLSMMKFGKQGYIFVGTWDGISLLGPARGENMMDVTDTNGVKIVRELIALSQTGGGYLHYVMPEFEGTVPRPKISYVKAVSEWEWYVGLGIYVYEIDSLIEKNRKKLRSHVTRLIHQILILSLVIVCIVFIVALFISKKINGEYQVFSKFFNQSAESYGTIDIDQMSLSEFRNLAESANHMIVKRKEAERKLKETKNMLNDIIDFMPSIVIGLNEDQKITLWNSCAQNKTGISQGEALGEKLTDIVPAYNQYSEDIQKALATQEIIIHEKLVNYCEEDRYYNDLVIYPVLDEEKTGVVIRIDDTTERVKMQELMILNDKMLTVGGLAAGMAHEINNPLGIIIQGIQSVIRRISPGESRNSMIFKEYGIEPDALQRLFEDKKILHYLDGMLEAGIRASKIIQNMLEFSRGSKSARNACDINDIIDKSIDLAINDYDLKKKYDFRNINIVKNYDTQIQKSLCSSTEVEQVFLNLLKNAAQAMAERTGISVEPEIQIKTYQRYDKIVIEICDNGPGIPAHIQKHIFEPFFSTKDTGQGTGLGLYISYFIITNNHQGSISVASKEGEWTCFSVSLPAVAGQ